MRIGTSIALLVIGGILAAALEFEIPIIDLAALGSILFIMGLVGLVLTVGLEVYQSRSARPRHGRRRRDRDAREAQRRREPERNHDPVLPPRSRSPRRPPASEDPTRVAPRRD